MIASGLLGAKGPEVHHFVLRSTKERQEVKKPASDEEDEDSEDDKPEDDESVEDDAESRATKGSTIENSDLPPIHEIPNVAQHLKGRKMRVATMCSGTESPLLALNLIQRSIKEHYDMELEYEHVFSCEIEPFKQAYIERNFQPPLLFRDVCELGDDEATTAYGALAPVPGDVDLLVAGTSCVDYSNLNNEKQDIDANGESGRTFRGMMSWVKKHRPPLVILENVCSAPWDKVAKYFAQHDYSASHLRVDTKTFYIPHTRTRVYLLAVDKRRSDLPEAWMDLLSKLKRPASSTLDAFLLPTDDPRIHQARQKLANEANNSSRSAKGRVIDWGRCESRHQRARLEEQLGTKRPLTSWEEGGFCKLPDFAWNDWGTVQVERVWDLMDISLLRSAKKGVDSSFKTQVWNLSQNVDRSTGSSKPGICPCLTPTMIPYITNRGGPMVGLEALSMQGLPVNELLLTRETEDQLADLAGNAMSTTVVGACILAALVVGRKLLKEGSDTRTYGEHHEDKMDEDVPEAKEEDEIMEQLKKKPLNLAASSSKLSLQGILEQAKRSVRLCGCEGRKGMTDRTLNRCGGRPEHNYEPIDLKAHPRLSPATFEKDLKAILPMSLRISNVSNGLLDKLAVDADLDVASSRWTGWRDAVLRAVEPELRFVEPKRQELWSIVYQSSTAKLELSLHPQQPEWRLFTYPLANEPANAEIRRVLEAPVGRFTCVNGLLSGTWQFALPVVSKFDVTVEGSEELVPSWEQKIGLQGDEFKARSVHAQLKITVRRGEWISHKRTTTKADEHMPSIFMLIDPMRCGDVTQDSFVFSISTRRYEFGEHRPTIASFDPKWRQSDTDGPEIVKCTVPCRWVEAQSVKMVERHALLVARVSLGDRAGPEWPRGPWLEVDKVHERSTFRSLAWLVERIRNIEGQFNEWQSCGEHDGQVKCRRCAPVPPSIRWTKVKKRIAAFEDSIEAGEFERSLKRRPAPFVTQLKLDEKGDGVVRIGVNLSSLMHRALSRLPPAVRAESSTLSWKLNTDFTPAISMQFPTFELASNKHDEEHTQPPNFVTPLRPEQLRSLSWMLAQESKEAPPFIEEEISEAILEPLGWRAEGRAQRPHHIRGGVLADQVGYGKTAISLGLIDCATEDVNKEFKQFKKMKGHIATKATLIIVPPHLTRQWESETRKFAKKHFVVVVLHTATNINALKIEDVLEADIVIVASNLFRSTVYQDNLEVFAGAGELPVQDGRFFDARLDITLKGLEEQVERLRNDGAKAVFKQILEGRKIDEAAQLFVPTKRLKGKSYRDAADNASEDESPKPKAKPKAKAKDEKVKADPPKVKKAASEAAKPKNTNISPRTGLTAEVVIPSFKGRGGSPSASSVATAPPTSEAEMEEESDAPRARRAVKRKAIVISDDDSEDEAPKKKGKTAAKAKKRPTKRSKASDDSDYEGAASEASDEEDFVAEESESDENFEEESDEDEKPKKAKAKAKPPPKKRASAKKSSTTSGSEDAMDVDDDDDDDDDDEKPKGKGKKPAKKPKAEAKPAKPKKRREESDPWKLKSSAVQNDWKRMQAPPLEMFHFARKIVDEYTYLDGKVLSMVTRVQAERHWVLSGTPPTHDFGALKTISAFLNIHLGIDDDNEGQSLQVKKRKREQTAVEKFHSFREVHSLEWHAHRVELGQKFLGQFVRQNIAEIDEISWSETIVKVYLPAAERAIYLELEHYLPREESESDREKRLSQALGDSSTAEEALLKRCSHFDLDISDRENAMKACEVIVEERTKQLEDCKKDLLKKLNTAVQMDKKIGRVPDESLFREFIRVTRTEGVGDQEATEAVCELLDEANVPAPLKSATNKAGDSNKRGGKSDIDLSNAVKALIWDHREQTHEIRRVTKELVGRFRSLRYFTVDVAVLSSCGHVGCYACVLSCAEKEECVYAASGACRAAARVLNVVKGDTLGVDDEARDGRGRHFGRKLEMIVDLIKNKIPKEDRVLIFVQFPDLTLKVAQALEAHKIAFLEIKGSASVKSKNLEKFQNESKERVLLLNVMDESASGANLTSANHAIFVSPLLAPTQEIYDACETQAIGRLRRYGQLKHVNIWRFISMNTIDVEIFEQRTGRKIE
ncbi:uncharacterized protein BXZ73DRAFT_92885 [Epithele typhae]|uniref:uncharacterized protein n=1 Tax=Epithele typhae TaxID=378194 RepID=UPI00200811D7|nr:uncharacterized protein BXZ73DRAFT_92885 [Epithele typhae]KAH9913975.1 hypothetical protein BXZ73DRAFT_92885 [Epithele typhae]